jgi:hypothetical protein
LVRSFERHLRAENRSERTVENYLKSLHQAEVFLRGRGWRGGAAAKWCQRRGKDGLLTFVSVRLLLALCHGADSGKTAGTTQPTTASVERQH